MLSQSREEKRKRKEKVNYLVNRANHFDSKEREKGFFLIKYFSARRENGTDIKTHNQIK